MKALAPLVLSFSLMGVAMAAEPAQSNRRQPSVTVVGSGDVSAKPDMAHVQIGVVEQAQTAAKALAANTAAMEELLKTLSARGIAEADIQTADFSVSPRYRQGPNVQTPEIIGYQVSNQVSVRVRNLSLLGPVLDEVVGKGANQIHGISFAVNDPNPILDQARQKAVQDAHRKAELYAKTAGVKLGRVLRIEESLPHLPRGEVLNLGMARAAAPVPIAPGEQKYQASIVITYAIEP
jgi:uncharacterized protein YggE